MQGASGLVIGLIQVAIVVFITTRLRGRRRRQWERSQSGGAALA
jgi:hypothetical protein